MVEFKARCMKCKKETKIINPHPIQMKNNLWRVAGKCEFGCGTTVSKIVGKEKPEILDKA